VFQVGSKRSIVRVYLEHMSTQFDMAKKPKVSPMSGLSVPYLPICEFDNSTVNAGDLHDEFLVPDE